MIVGSCDPQYEMQGKCMGGKKALRRHAEDLLGVNVLGVTGFSLFYEGSKL